MPLCLVVENPLGVPSFFAAMTMRWHQVTGVPIAMTPSWMSLSNPALTASLQWMGMSLGEWMATGVASSLMSNLMGGPDIMGSGWCSQVLNVLEE